MRIETSPYDDCPYDDCQDFKDHKDCKACQNEKEKENENEANIVKLGGRINMHAKEKNCDECAECNNNNNNNYNNEDETPKPVILTAVLKDGSLQLFQLSPSTYDRSSNVWLWYHETTKHASYYPLPTRPYKAVETIIKELYQVESWNINVATPQTFHQDRKSMAKTLQIDLELRTLVKINIMRALDTDQSLETKLQVAENVIQSIFDDCLCLD